MSNTAPNPGTLAIDMVAAACRSDAEAAAVLGATPAATLEDAFAVASAVISSLAAIAASLLDVLENEYGDDAAARLEWARLAVGFHDPGADA